MVVLFMLSPLDIPLHRSWLMATEATLRRPTEEIPTVIATCDTYLDEGQDRIVKGWFHKPTYHIDDRQKTAFIGVNELRRWLTNIFGCPIVTMVTNLSLADELKPTNAVHVNGRQIRYLMVD